MARNCTVCTHDRRTEIERALVEREPYRNVSKMYGVGMRALQRHHANDHIPQKLIRAHAAREAAEADELLASVLSLRDKALALLERAEAEDDRQNVAAAIREARGCLTLLAKLAGELQDGGATINVIQLPAWTAVQSAIMGALREFPEARAAVADALAGLAGERVAVQPQARQIEHQPVPQVIEHERADA